MVWIPSGIPGSRATVHRRNEPRGKVTVDLYEAFEAVCRDEEALRTDLGKYSKEGLTPRQVPPLVHQHLSTLPVTSKNKRFNAGIRSQDFAGEWTEKTSAPTASTAVQENLNLASVFLKSVGLSKCDSLDFANKDGKSRHFRAFIGTASGLSVLGFLKEYLWADGQIRISRMQLHRKGDWGGEAHTVADTDSTDQTRTIESPTTGRCPRVTKDIALACIAVTLRSLFGTRVTGRRLPLWSDVVR